MESQTMKPHISLERAVDIALWMNFKYRLEKNGYSVVQDKRTKLYHINPPSASRKSNQLILPADYSQMTYEQIENIRSEKDPLHHWESIMGEFTTIHGELLRFILAYKVPLEKIIRFELSSRGFDENNLCVGFEKAKAIWQK